MNAWSPFILPSVIRKKVDRQKDEIIEQLREENSLLAQKDQMIKQLQDEIHQLSERLKLYENKSGSPSLSEEYEVVPDNDEFHVIHDETLECSVENCPYMCHVENERGTRRYCVIHCRDLQRKKAINIKDD